ncbi:LETM1 domain-containing protein 1 isoform X2 [Leptinotarsa decemlineata]|nr:LETM1 domain-containing protein 1 isoform X2 [Leptinotarsa decemlineata]
MTSLPNISRLRGCSLTTVRIFYSSGCHHRKSIYKTDEAKKLRFFFLTRYIDYLKNYDTGIEKRLTGALQIYRTFMDGVKEFIQDTKDYFRIMRMLNAPGRNFSMLLRREIELYHQMPKDMRKVAPVLLIASLPLGPYVILPLAYMLPRHLLCSHFWTLEQKSKFSILNLRDRLSHNRPVFRHLQSQLDFLKPHHSYDLWNGVLAKLGSGTQPHVEEIIRCKELFTTEPYHLFYLSRRHVVHLLKMHDMHTGWFRRSRLAEKAFILKEMDKAIMREGGVHNLPIEAMRKSCYIRGLNPTTLSKEEMIKWLTDWIQLSSHIDKECYSLLLHAPILLGYNKPSNWVLIYKDKL